MKAIVNRRLVNPDGKADLESTLTPRPSPHILAEQGPATEPGLLAQICFIDSKIAAAQQGRADHLRSKAHDGKGP